MGKLILWIVIVFAILFALRLWNARKSSARSNPDAGKPKPGATPELMVRCGQCGVFLPKVDARATADGYCCSEPGCTRRTPGSGSR